MLHSRLRNLREAPHAVLQTGASHTAGRPTGGWVGTLIGWIGNRLPWLVMGTLCAALIEILAPLPYKISTVTGGYFGNEKLVTIVTELDGLRSAAAAQADAAIHAQQLVEVFRAQNERLTGGCQALFQQVGMLNQAIANTQEQYIAKRQEILAATLSGKMARAAMTSMSPAYGQLLGVLFGDQQPNESPEVMRKKILQEYDRVMQESMEKAMENIRRWQPGVGKMGTISSMVPADCITSPQIVPADTPPAPPARYRRATQAGRG